MQILVATISRYFLGENEKLPFEGSGICPGTILLKDKKYYLVKDKSDGYPIEKLNLEV